RQPAYRSNRGRQRRLPRAIGGGGMVCNGRPQTGILDVPAEQLEAETAVRSLEQVDATIMLAVLEAFQDDPRLVDACRHRSIAPAPRAPPQDQWFLPRQPRSVEQPGWQQDRQRRRIDRPVPSRLREQRRPL